MLMESSLHHKKKECGPVCVDVFSACGNALEFALSQQHKFSILRIWLGETGATS